MDKLIPLTITDTDLADVRAFYADRLGWEVTIEMDGYLQVRHGGGDDDPELSFGNVAAMAPLGIDTPTFGGDGLMVQLRVADADAHRAAVVGQGVTPLTEATDKPWRVRSYVVEDPTGVRLDVFHPLEQAAA